jgi:ssDNA-specific exonuclease RecJ
MSHKTSLEKSAVYRRRQQSIKMNGFGSYLSREEIVPNIYGTVKLPCALDP